MNPPSAENIVKSKMHLILPPSRTAQLTPDPLKRTQGTYIKRQTGNVTSCRRQPHKRGPDSPGRDHSSKVEVRRLLKGCPFSTPVNWKNVQPTCIRRGPPAGSAPSRSSTSPAHNGVLYFPVPLSPRGCGVCLLEEVSRGCGNPAQAFSKALPSPPLPGSTPPRLSPHLPPSIHRGPSAASASRPLSHCHLCPALPVSPMGLPAIRPPDKLFL